MIERLKIENFKAFGPSGIDLPLKPITVLLGENSIGKSSILQALVALQQSWQRFPDVYWYTPKGREIDLGRFGHLVHTGSTHGEQYIGITAHHEGGRSELRWGGYTTFSETLNSPNARTRCADQGQLSRVTVGSTFPFSFLPYWSDEFGTLELVLSRATVQRWIDEKRPGSNLLEIAISEGYGLVWIIARADGVVPRPVLQQIDPPDSYFLQDEVLSSQDIETNERNHRVEAIEDILAQLEQTEPAADQIWTQATLQLEKLTNLWEQMSTLCYIDGLRDRGKRVYDLNLADRTWRVGRSGERMVDVLVGRPETETRVNDLLRASELGFQVKVNDPETHAQVREVLVQTNENRTPLTASLPDVGTGIAQILPIVVQIAALADGARFPTTPLLLVEQPELHLHPRFQAQLARLFASAVAQKPSEDDKSKLMRRAVQIVAETHSEHLVLGLGVLIYDGILDPEDVCILKLFKDNLQQVKAERIRFSQDGRFLDEWPGGFFPERHELEAGRLP